MGLVFLVQLYVGKVFGNRCCERTTTLPEPSCGCSVTGYSMVGRIEFGLLARRAECRILPVLADAFPDKLLALIPDM